MTVVNGRGGIRGNELHVMVVTGKVTKECGVAFTLPPPLTLPRYIQTYRNIRKAFIILD